MPAKRAKRSLFARSMRVLLLLPTLFFIYLAYIYLTLPDVRPLAKQNPKTTAFMEIRKAEARRAGREKFTIRQQWIPYRQISPFLRRAVIVTEDAAFFDHDGIDLNEIKASLEKNWEQGQFLRGGSTITQQLAKNLYLSESRNPIRKLTELLIARRLEAALTKERIFEIYLNMIEWGDGIFGCELASRVYFGKSCSNLDVPEAALLAGSIINPREHSPAKPTKRLLRRQQIILRRMQFKPPPPPEPVAPPPANPEEGVPVGTPKEGGASTPTNQTPINGSPVVPPVSLPQNGSPSTPG